jgi:nuclear pore complex protein Nup155
MAYDPQIPPFNDQANVQAISSDIAVLLHDWLDEMKRPSSQMERSAFPVGRIDQYVDAYIRELEPALALPS